MDGLLFVNAELLGLFFMLFGSRFIVSPGVELENPDFHVPRAVGAMSTEQPTRLVIDLPRPGIAYTENAQQTYARLAEWLQRQAAQEPGGRVLIRADAGAVPMQDLFEVYGLVRAAGFKVQVAAYPERMRGSWNDVDVPLTVTEFWMVHALVRYPGHVKSRDQLMREAQVVVDDATVTSHVKRMRRQFEAIDPHFAEIETMHGAGYRWRP